MATLLAQARCVAISPESFVISPTFSCLCMKLWQNNFCERNVWRAFSILFVCLWACVCLFLLIYTKQESRLIQIFFPQEFFQHSELKLRTFQAQKDEREWTARERRKKREREIQTMTLEQIVIIGTWCSQGLSVVV